MSPAEYLAEHPSNLGGHLDIRFTSHDPDRVTAEMQAGKQHLTIGGRVHGGALMAFADTVAAYATVLNLPSSKHATATIESKTNFLSGGQPGTLYAETVALHRGRRTVVWQTSIRSVARDLLAIVLQTQIIIDPKS